MIGSSVFSVKSSLRAKTTKTKPSGYARPAKNSARRGGAMVSAYAPVTRLKPTVSPDASAD